MSLSRFFLPFSAGVAAGAFLTKNWPKIKEQAVPASQAALRDVSDALEKGRQACEQVTGNATTEEPTTENDGERSSEA